MGPSVRWDDDVGTVIPAQAGTQCLLLSVHARNASRWVPAFAGMTELLRPQSCHFSERWNPLPVRATTLDAKSKMGPSVTRRASVESRWDDDAGTVIPAQAGTQCLSLSVHGSNASHWFPA